MKNLEKNLKEFVEKVCTDTINNGRQERVFSGETFQEFLKLNRINKTTFGKIIGVSGSTINKYYNNPMLLKMSQVYSLSLECNEDVRNVINRILE